jgi:hypothetical protein
MPWDRCGRFFCVGGLRSLNLQQREVFDETDGICNGSDGLKNEKELVMIYQNVRVKINSNKP